MQRNARPSVLISQRRRSLQLQRVDLAKWPDRLKLALAVIETNLPPETARSLMLESGVTAQEYEIEIGRRQTASQEFKARRELFNSCRIVANCIRRMSAKFNAALSSRVLPLIREETIDLESIGSIFDSTAGLFNYDTKQEPARTALRHLKGTGPASSDARSIKDRYESLNSKLQRRIEKRIEGIRRTIAPEDVFDCIASVANTRRMKAPDLRIHEIIVRFVVSVGAHWQSAGLRPSRDRRHDAPEFIGAFHRFCDLILTEIREPQSIRYLSSEARRAPREPGLVNKKLPPGFAEIPQRERREDRERLISDSHIKKALRILSKKRAAKVR